MAAAARKLSNPLWWLSAQRALYHKMGLMFYRHAVDCYQPEGGKNKREGCTINQDWNVATVKLRSTTKKRAHLRISLCQTYIQHSCKGMHLGRLLVHIRLFHHAMVQCSGVQINWSLICWEGAVTSVCKMLVRRKQAILFSSSAVRCCYIVTHQTVWNKHNWSMKLS